MTLHDLQRRMAAEYFAPHAYHVGEGWARASDAWCLARAGEAFEIFYVERGKKGHVYGRYAREAEACEAFYAMLSGQSTAKAHLVGFFRDAAQADRAVALLAAHGIRVERDRILYAAPDDLRERLFVFGADVVRATELLGPSPAAPA